MTYYERRLPHWQMPGQDVFITWRLYGSLPPQFRPPIAIGSTGKAFVSYDHVLDEAQTGPLWLRDPRIAEAVLNALRGAQRRKMFTLRAYAIMANHVHVLLEPQLPIDQITKGIKGASARETNLILGHTGVRFWQAESFDHWIRNPAEWQKIRNYIEQNPVAAGLVLTPQDWPWSSGSNPIE